jgi:multisubunit Na+/H+ antiporter MnhB subunit
LGYFIVENIHIKIYFQAFPPANAIFAGIGVLLLVRILHLLLARTILTRGSQAAVDASTGQEKIINAFNRIEHFFRRLEIYTMLTPTGAMTDMIVEIMVEVLMTLAIITEEAKRGLLSELILRVFTLS